MFSLHNKSLNSESLTSLNSWNLPLRRSKGFFFSWIIVRRLMWPAANFPFFSFWRTSWSDGQYVYSCIKDSQWWDLRCFWARGDVSELLQNLEPLTALLLSAPCGFHHIDLVFISSVHETPKARFVPVCSWCWWERPAGVSCWRFNISPHSVFDECWFNILSLLHSATRHFSITLEFFFTALIISLWTVVVFLERLVWHKMLCPPAVSFFFSWFHVHKSSAILFLVSQIFFMAKTASRHHLSPYWSQDWNVIPT